MLAISPLTRPTTKDGSVDQGDIDISTCSTTTPSTPCSFSVLDFPEFSAPVGVGCLLDSIDFDNLIHDGDMLSDLEMDTHFMAEFSSVVCPSYYVRDLDDDSAVSTQADTGIQVVPDCYVDNNDNNANLAARWNFSSKKVEGKVSAMEESIKDDEIDSGNSTISTPPAKEREKLKKLPSSQAKKYNKNNNNQGKRKTKVDWTPDLHRRFVQAVETLGVDKAVPSRILELMGIDCLTRHNVASHLQKYRSHRKHLLAREAEAASWSQKRQMYGVAVALGSGGGGGWSKMSHPWHPPTLGFPPMTTPPPIHHTHPFRPLQVWGHPTHNAEHPSVMAIWPKQLIVPSPSPHRWVAPPPTHHPQPPIVDPSFWHPHHHHVPNGVTPTTSQTQTTRFVEAPLVTGIPPPHATMYKPGHSPPTSAKPGPSNHPPLDLFPTKESIDTAIGDVLTKPWLPLPIGLKPPSTDSVMVELQRQGIPKIPPSCS